MNADQLTPGVVWEEHGHSPEGKEVQMITMLSGSFLLTRAAPYGFT